MLNIKLILGVLIVYIITSGSTLLQRDIVIKFKPINPDIKYIILKNNIEEFQIEYDKYQDFRKFHIDSFGMIKISKVLLEKDFLEGDSIMDAFYCDSRLKRFTRFKINANKDTNHINIPN